MARFPKLVVNVRRFAIRANSVWLKRGITHTDMEATGVYWRPVHSALKGSFTLIVGNASVPIRESTGRSQALARRRARSWIQARWTMVAAEARVASKSLANLRLRPSQAKVLSMA